MYQICEDKTGWYVVCVLPLFPSAKSLPLFFFIDSERVANRSYINAVKALRSLRSGEDDDLKMAYERFNKVVQREQDIVLNTTLVGVETLKLRTLSMHGDVMGSLAKVDQLQLDTTAIHTNVRDGLTITQRIDENIKSIMAGRRLINQDIESKLVYECG